MIAQGTNATDVTPEQLQQVAEDVELFCQANKVPRRAVADAIGYTPGVISEFLKGTYKGNSGQIAIDLDDWMVEEEKRRANLHKTEFVWTNVARQIQSVAAYCMDHRKVGLVYGPETSGIGKTTSFRAIQQELGPRRCALVTLDKCDANPTGLLKKILASMRLENSGSNAQKMATIIDHLMGRSHLLLIDQVHNLRFAKEDRPFYYLMDIYEASKTAQLWAGTSDLVAYLQGQKAKTLDEPLAQIRRRIFPCVDLMESSGPEGGGDPLYTTENIRDMFAKFPLKLTNAAARWLCALARVPGSGGIGTCENLMEFATYLGQSVKAGSIDIPLLKQALKCGLTAERAQWTLVQTESFMESKLKVA